MLMTWLKSHSDGCIEYEGYWVLVLHCAQLLTYTEIQRAVDLAVTWIYHSNNVLQYAITLQSTSELF